jgi:23S rRNA (uracil1939-C5)-methyltransferase
MSSRPRDRLGRAVEVLVQGLDGEASPRARPVGGGAELRVPHGVPGDRLLVREAGGGWARILEILDPSPDRVEPPCVLSRTCGNCPWMSVSLAAQRRAREDLVYRWIEKEAGVPRGEIPEALGLHAVGEGLGYRSRARFQAGLGGKLLGFHLRRGPRVLEVLSCPLLSPPLDSLFRSLRRVLSARPVPDLTGLEVVSAAGEEGAAEGAVLLNPRDRAPEEASELAARLLAEVPGLAGVAWQGGSSGRPWVDAAVGPADASLGGPVAVRREAGAFSQVNDGANALLVEEVLRALATAPLRLLELHAGSGNLSLPLAAAGHDLLSVESQPRALAALKISARDLPEGSGPLRALREDAGRALARAADDGTRFDAALLDPPRSGVGKLAADLLRLGPARLVLVSCRPPALARDLVPLLHGGYRLSRVVPIDFFPHTRHVEAVVRLDRI